MKNRLRFTLVLGLLSAASVFAQEFQTPQQLIESSRQASDLAQVSPYQLRATVALTLGSAKEVLGQITVLRDRDQYRSELWLAQYHEVRWIHEGMLHIWRSQPIPVPKTTLLRRIDLLWRMDLLPPNTKASKISRAKRNHELVDCFEVSRNDKADKTKEKFCFDGNAALVAKRYDLHDLEFRDFSTFEQKYFPKRIVFRARDRAVLEVRDISITKSHFEADVFNPPEGVARFDTCDDPVPARQIQEIAPQIPKAELLQLRSAEVYLFGLIGTDGTVQNLSVQYSPHPSFTQSAMDAVKQWRYSPAMCGDKAVPMETEMHISYFVP